ncbi:hypothetical protein AKJ09_02453 [Labilithrix luteola]|uniref:Uncharacterized protein n=2 Tax=Labilithrix luteola TaxID=1391654 RepID=A0A0K1PRP6_9BACT|nr:hypothetical protein AKJ09_02453 [Labilithrix luteola]
MIAWLATPLASPLGCGAATDIDSQTEALRASCSGAAGMSSVTDGHTHDICITEQQLETLPESGVVDATTIADGHSHTVTLSQTALQRISVGQTVGVETSVALGHTHTFTLHKGPSSSSSSSSSSSGAGPGQFGY